MTPLKLAKRIAKHVEKSNLYTAGNTISYKRLTSATKHLFPNLVGRNPDLTSDTYAFITAYTRLNKFLALRGIQLRSNKLKSFSVLTTDQCTNKVARMQARANCTMKAASTLQVGTLFEHGVMSAYKPDEIERISHHIYTSVKTSPYGK